MTPNSQCQVIFQRPYVRVFLLNDLACFSFRSAAAAILVREPLQKASKPYKGSSQADIDAGQVESRSKNWQALLCTARAASAVHEFFQFPDAPTELDTYQQMLATDKLLEYAEISLRTLCDLIRYQQLKELGVVHSAKEFIQLFHSNEQEDTP